MLALGFWGCSSGKNTLTETQPVVEEKPRPLRKSPFKSGPKKSSPIPHTFPKADIPLERDTVHVGIALKQKNITVETIGGVAVYGLGQKSELLAQRVRGAFVVKIHRGNLQLLEEKTSKLLARSKSGFKLVSHNPLNTLHAGGHHYRGELHFRPEGPYAFNVINQIHLEEYLRGVLPYEMPAKDVAILEALKAQAVAARTYAVINLHKNRDKHFDVVATVQDQVYRGIEAETFLSDKAVQETRGLILTYKGNLANCFYHSHCGGRTAAIQDVWNSKPVPYLLSEMDINEDGLHYGSGSRWSQWERQWRKDEMIYVLNQFVKSAGAKTAGAFKQLRDIQVSERSPSGRVREINIQTDGEIIQLHKDKTRWAFRDAEPPHAILPSSWFEVDSLGETVRISGKGNGHGVGMCQIGAMGRAKEGQRFVQILSAYYRGTQVAQLPLPEKTTDELDAFSEDF